MDKKIKFPSVEALKKRGIYEEVRIRCRYCDIRDKCHLRPRKESYENAGWMTRCIFTPNRPKKNKKK